MYYYPQMRKDRCNCGKVCFSKKEAQSRKNFLEKIGNEKKLRIYQCPFCDWWHLTKHDKHKKQSYE